MRKLTTQVVVRIDDALREALQADADANGRTVAQTVRFQLRQAMTARLASRQATPEGDS